ncbi:hypothetical protein FRC08_004807 [Ceratobasidium sp. 394]|nr:hypothetical protein FRC08_004807 [Ceratobasidium sp. 394]
MTEPIGNDDNKDAFQLPPWPPTHHFPPYPSHPSHLLPHASSTSRAPAPRRSEFAVPVLPQRSHSVGTVGLTSISGTSSQSAGAKRGRRPYAGEKQDAIWSPEVQEAFLQAARSIPNNGKNWIMRDGRQYGRNALIAEEIHRLTGQHRTRQQISSHIQVLKKVHADDPAMIRILNGQLDELPASAGPAQPTGSASSSASPPVIKTEESGGSASPPPPFVDPIHELVDGSTSFINIIRSRPPQSTNSDSLPSTPQSSRSTAKTEPMQLAELLPRSALPAIPVPRATSEPLVAELDGVERHPGAWRGERLAYITAITIWAERTLNDAGVCSRPTTTHVFAQMHSARCPLEKLPADMEEIVRTIGPGTCMHAEIGIALPPPGLNVGKIRATLVIEAMRQFDGYCLTDAFIGEEGRFMSTHTTVFPTGREAREKYSWTYEIPYATEVWKRVLTQNPQGAHGMRLVQKYVRSLAGGNRDGDQNVALMVVHDIKVVRPGEVGYSKIKHVDLTGEQAKHDAMSVGVVVNGSQDDDEDESSADGEVAKDDDDAMAVDSEQSNKRPKPNLSVAIPPVHEGRPKLRTRQSQLAATSSQPVTPFDQVVHTPQHPPPLQRHGQDMRRWLWAPTPTEGSIPGAGGMKSTLGDETSTAMGGAIRDGGDRMSWFTRDALAAGTPQLSDFGRELDAPMRIEGRDKGEYFGMN